jgi:ABC-type molybdenum transport system ATPase subunit/photorepair protein PhrA
VVETIAKTVDTIRLKDAKETTDEEVAYIQEAGRMYESRINSHVKNGDHRTHGIRWRALEARTYQRAWSFARGRLAHPTEGESNHGRVIFSRDGFPISDAEVFVPGEPIVEMNGIKVTYGKEVILGGWEQDVDGKRKEGLWWTVRRGERWGIFGPNGSGKTTLTALMMSDHPQSYCLPIKIFGKSRLATPGEPGVSIFDLQSNIGISSPELHSLFPKHLTVRRVLESAWAETPLSPVSQLTADIDSKVTSALRWFQGELCPDLGDSALYQRELLRVAGSYTVGPAHLARLESQQLEHAFDPTSVEWADYRTFGGLPFASQRLLLFLRAIIKQPDLVILDEAFSGMDANTVHKCHLFLSHGENRILQLHSHNGQVRMRQASAPSDLSKTGLAQIPGLSPEQALVFISHRQEEVPGCVREWLCLPEPGTTEEWRGGSRAAPPRFGRLDGPLEATDQRWREVWALPQRRLARMPRTGMWSKDSNMSRDAIAAAALARKRMETPEQRAVRKKGERARYEALGAAGKERRMLRDLVRGYKMPWDRAARVFERVGFTLASARVVLRRVEERRAGRSRLVE